MLGPHHLNEVFFDGVRVTEGQVLGGIGQGWQVVQEVLAFERVGIARYARCERLLLAAPRILGDQWETLPEELRTRWVRMLVHCRRARLLAYKVLSRQSQGAVSPADTAAYRIAVTTLDQDSADVLTEILDCASLPASTPVSASYDHSKKRLAADSEWFRLEVEDHWRYSRASTIASGSVEIQRVLLSRAVLK
jgi:alkylation response protein AidB-like acyl-CoA dehydrogenase